MATVFLVNFKHCSQGRGCTHLSREKHVGRLCSERLRWPYGVVGDTGGFPSRCERGMGIEGEWDERSNKRERVSGDKTGDR